MPGRGSRELAEGQSHHLESLPTPSASEATKPKLLLLGQETDEGMFSPKNSGSFVSSGAGDSILQEGTLASPERAEPSPPAPC